MRPSNYTCFTGTQVLGQFGKTGPEYPKSCAGTHESNPKSSALCFRSLAPYSSAVALCRLSFTYFTSNWALGQFGETGPKYPKSCAGTHEK